MLHNMSSSQCLECNNCLLRYSSIIHANVIFSQLDSLTPDANDIIKNAKGHREMEAQMRKKGINKTGD